MKIVKLSDVIIVKKGKKPSILIEEKKEGYEPYILIEQMEWNPIRQYTNDNCPTATKDDILMVRDWSIWKTATNIEWIIWSTIVAITPLKINKSYLYYFIEYSKPTILANPKWSWLAHINPDIFWNLEVPFYSIPQQQAIVDEIEKQFSRLDNWLQSLENIKTDLKSYKASVLKSAVEGKLTEQWRKGNKNIEPASNLLERILSERKQKWKQENPWKKYKEPKTIDTSELGKLPDGWCWCSIENTSDNIVDCLHSTPSFKVEWKYCIDTNNIKPWKIIFEKIRFVDNETFQERIRRLKPQIWDVLFSREWALLGVAVYVDFDAEFCLWQRIMMFRTSRNLYWKFLEIILNSEFFKAIYKPKIWWTAAPHLNISDIRQIHIPLAPLAEQHHIVTEVEKSLSIIESMSVAIESNIKRAKQLKQSILHQAFTGNLVPMQNDKEWVERLLAEIEKMKTELGKQKKSKKK